MIPFRASGLKLCHDIYLFTGLSLFPLSFIHSFNKEIRSSHHASEVDTKVQEVRENLLLNQGPEKQSVHNVYFLRDGECAHSVWPCLLTT